EERTKRTTEPIVGGDVETNFRPTKNGIRKLATHKTFQDYFLHSADNLQMVRQRSGELDDPVVKVGRTNLERVSHAHAVDFLDKTIGQIVALIEGKITGEVACAVFARNLFIEKIADRSGLEGLEQITLLILGKRAVPESVCLVRRQQRAFQEALQLVLEADF